MRRHGTVFNTDDTQDGALSFGIWEKGRNEMKILHIGDLHLDSAFSGFDKEGADKMRAMSRECFQKTMDIARERGVSLVLVAGDLFDTPFCTSATRKIVFDAISSVGCPVVISPGNHDYYNKNGTYADKNLPENAYVFTSAELGRFDFDELGVTVIGYAFTSDRYEENPLSGDVPLSSDNVNILCAHTEIGVPLSKYAPMNMAAMARCGFTYAALGHIHAHTSPSRMGNTTAAYCGFAQGRSFDELGEGGAYIVDLDIESGAVELERIVVSDMRYEIIKLDISTKNRDSDVIKMIEDEARTKNFDKKVALRVVLVGAVPSDYSMDEKAIENAPELSFLALVKIKNKCVANFDLEYLKTDMTVRGEVYRSLLPMLESSDADERKKASMALKFALSALDKREISVD